MKPDPQPQRLKITLEIESICSELESAWQTQQPLPLEQLLSRIEEDYRPALLFELLLLEFHYRQADSDRLEIEHYYDRFPQHEVVINQAWEKLFGPIEPAAGDQPATHQPQAIQARYSKQSLHRQGGIGRIWIAHDSNLDRPVALKDLQPQYTEDPAARERFIREAQITGKLDHPNIVPVYQLRHGSDVSEPFYTMRLVAGKTLRELIGQYHQELNRRNQVHLLNILNTVCQAIAYAHSQGVIHRDLKPANIVVGEFGEIFVLDWGLAKLIDTATVISDEPPISPLATSSETNPVGKTVVGARIGTPAYMAPEQAAGAIDEIGFTTDVYGLGSILFEILTGQPPYQGDDAIDVMQEIQHEPTPTARDRNAAVPPALDAICSKAMSKDPSQRYASALDLKNELQSWLADEPVDSYLDPWWARCSRWTRHHRRLINSAALLMLLAALGLGIGNGLLNRAHQRTQEQKKTAEADFQRARSVIEGLSLDINSLEAQQLSGFKPLQRQLTQQLLDFYLYFLEQHRDEPAYRADIADVHYQLGVLATSLETLDAASLHYENSLKVLLQLAKDEPRHKPHRRKLSECYNGLGTLSQASGDLMAAEKNYLQASQLAEKLASEPPASDRDHQLQMTVLNNLATLYMTRGNATEAIACFQKILVSPEEGKPAVARTTLAAHLNLSVLYRTTGKLPEASRCLEKARQILDQLRKDQFNPEFLHDQQLAWYISQTNLEISLGHWEAARKTSAAGVQAAEVLVASHPGEVKYEVSLAQLHLNATAIGTSIGLLQQASDSAQKAILILHRLRDKDPGNLKYQTDLARGLHNFAEAERRLQHRETALRTIQLAIQEKQRIVDRSPEDKYRHLLLSSRIVYADLMRDAKQTIPALEQYRDIYGTARELVEKNRDKLPYQFTLATVSHSLGQMEKENKEWDAAKKHYHEALKLRKQLSARNPQQVKLILDTSMTQYNLGNLHQVQTQLQPAIALYQESYATLLKVPEAQRQQAEVQKQLVNCHWAIAETSHSLKQFSVALKHWDEAIQLTTDNKFLAFLRTERQKTASQMPKKE